MSIQDSGSRHPVKLPHTQLRAWDVAASVAVFLVAFWTQRWVLDLPLTAIDTIPTLAAAKADSWIEIFEVLTRELRGGVYDHYYYRPLTLVSYALDQLVWGGSAWGYHFTDVALHSLAAVSVFALARFAVDLPRLAALGAATLFLVHPASIEVVPAIARRQEPLLVIGFCLAVIGGRRVPERVGWLLMILGSLIAVTSVERGLVVPGLVFGYLLFYRFAGSGLSTRILESARWTVPAVLVAGAFFLLRWALYGPAGAVLSADSIVSVPGYLGLWLVYPQQAIELVFPTSLAEVALFLAVVAPCAAAVIFLVLRASRRGILWCGLVWIGAYTLLLTIAGLLSPWYVYTAVPGLALIIVFFGLEAVRQGRHVGRARVRAGLSAGVALSLTAAMAVSSPVWSDYPAWRIAGSLSDKFFGELARLSVEIPVDEPIVIINLPAHFRESSSDNLVTRSAAILWPGSVRAWLRVQERGNDVSIMGSANFVEQIGVPKIEFTEDSVHVYFTDGESSYTNATSNWSGVEELPAADGRGLAFSWPAASRRGHSAHVFVFDGERLVPYEE